MTAVLCLPDAPGAAFQELGLLEKGARALLLLWFRRTGWRAAGALPQSRKFVNMGGPNTSHWDFRIFLSYPAKLGVIGPVIRPTGDYQLDMEPAFAFFCGLTPNIPSARLLRHNPTSRSRSSRLALRDD